MITFNVNDLLPEFRGKQFIGTSELASAATYILMRMGAVQERGTVKEGVEERTVRYYQTEGLLETPTEKRGTASVFEYRHLVTLVVIKTMQAQHLPIKKIRGIVREMSEGELEQVIRDFSERSSQDVQKGTEARRYLESLSEPTGWEPSSDLHVLASRRQPPEPKVHMSLLKMAAPPAFDRRQMSPPRSAPLQRSNKWTRHQLSSGIELHVREDAVQKLRGYSQKRLLAKIEKALLSLLDDT